MWKCTWPIKMILILILILILIMLPSLLFVSCPENGTNENQSSFNITGMRRELELLRDNNATLTAARLSLQYEYDMVHWDYYEREHQFLRYENYCSDLLFQIETLEDKKKEQELRIDQIGKKFVQSDQY